MQACMKKLIGKSEGMRLIGRLRQKLNGSKSNLIIVQQDATYSVYYISAGSSTCFGC